MSLMRFAEDAISHFERLRGGRVQPLGQGLINETFRVSTDHQAFVLQKVNAIFDPAIHHNIVAVTDRLVAEGVTTPRLELSSDGKWWVDLGDGGVWRAMSFVDGVSFEHVQSVGQAQAAAALIARFHAVLEDLEHQFVGTRLGVHDTEAHLALLRQALEQHADHRLYQPTAELGMAILAAAEQMRPLPELPSHVCHGDLKINNVLFASASGPGAERALCLIDLDTVGPMSLAHELGDAWRSWCNPKGEDVERPRFDMQIFEAAWIAYRDAVGREISTVERGAFVDAPAWISLELAARFAADALRECYFGFDKERFESAGEHNLVRAAGQWALHEATQTTREHRAHVLKVVPK